jgi:hypothetical protein
VTTNGLIAFAMGSLDHAWGTVVIIVIWLAVFLIACPTIDDISGGPTPPG